MKRSAREESRPPITDGERHRAPLQAENDLRAYVRGIAPGVERGGHPLFIWRAIATCYRAGIPVPVPIMAKLGEWAELLETADTPTEILDVLEFRQKGGQARTPAMAAQQDDMDRTLLATLAQVERRDALKALRRSGEELDARSLAESKETNLQIFRRISATFGKRPVRGKAAAERSLADRTPPATATTWKSLKGRYHALKKEQKNGATIDLATAWRPKQK